VAIATAEAAAAAAKLDGVRLRLASGVTRAFLETVVQERIALRLAQEDSLLLRAEATLNSRFAVGQARYVDVIRLRTERLRVQAELLDAQTEGSRAQLQLRALAGRDVPPVQAMSVTLRMPGVPSNVDSLLAAAPVLKMAAAEQERARAALMLASAEGTRRISGNIGVQRFTHDAGSTIGPAIGLSVSLPSTNRRMVLAGIEAAQIDSAASEAHTRATASLLRAEISAALSQIEATGRRIAGVDQQLINAAREEREAALTAYVTGDMTLIELLDFERSLSRAEVQLLQSYDAAIEAWDRANQLLADAGAHDGDSQ
jgi:outer membrane protein TolC